MAQLTGDINTVTWQYTIYLTLIMTSAHVVEMLVSVTNNIPSRDYSQLDDQTKQMIKSKLSTTRSAR